MNGGKKPLGYTIIEVMIVLAVSGLMFVIAGNFISGKQAKTSFNAGSNEMSSRVNDVLNQVASGRYTDRAFTCTAGLAAGSGPTYNTSLALQDKRTGSSPGCVFVGKLMYFNPVPNNDRYEVLSLGGNRLAPGSTKPAVTFSEISPTIIQGAGIDLTVKQNSPQLLSIKRIEGDGANASGFGFVQGSGALDPNTPTVYSSGSQSIGMVSVPLAYAPGTPLNLASIKQATICLTDDTRWAVVTVTLAGAETKFYSSVPAGPCS